MDRQLDLGIPQATYPIRVCCRRCGHMAELKLGIETLQRLNRLGCTHCGAKVPSLKIEQLKGMDLGG